MNDPVAGASPAASSDGLLGARIRIPRHVVYRRFPEETALLDINTGTYHTFAVRAAGMLEALEKSSSIREAAHALAADGRRAQGLIERDMCALCESLLRRGLLEVASAAR
jgi:hypothetical protein